MRKYLVLLICLVILVVVSNSCVKKLTVNPDLSISLTLDTLKIVQGSSQQLLSKNYNSASLNWNSSDTSIAIVSATGYLTAKKAGQSLLTVTNKDHSATATCTVYVLPLVSAGYVSIINGKGTDIGIGADSSVFVVGATTVSTTGGYSISRLVGNALVKLPDCAAIRVAVSPHGVPWVINKSNLIFRYNGSTWDQLPGTGTDIGIGADGSVFIIGTQDVSPTGGFNIMKWNGSGWDTLPECAGIRISVTPQGIPWVVNKSNIVYKNTGGILWEPVPGVLGNDIGIGADGSVYVAGKDSSLASYNPPIYQYTSAGWVAIKGVAGVAVAVSPKGKPSWIDKSNLIYRLN